MLGLMWSNVAKCNQRGGKGHSFVMRTPLTLHTLDVKCEA